MKSSSNSPKKSQSDHSEKEILVTEYAEPKAKSIPQLNSCMEEESLDTSFSCDLSESNCTERLAIFSNAENELQP